MLELVVPIPRQYLEEPPLLGSSKRLMHHHRLMCALHHELEDRLVSCLNSILMINGLYDLEEHLSFLTKQDLGLFVIEQHGQQLSLLGEFVKE